MLRRTTLILLAVLCLTTFAVPDAPALDIVPFDSINQSPLVQIYGLPGAGNFRLLAPGQTEVGMNMALSSNHAVDSNARESIVLDGETTRFTFVARHAFSPRLEAGIRIPFLIQGGGFLDGFIESYHSAFGFPQGGRDQAPRNRLLYRYQRNGIESLRLDSSASGMGDVGLTAAFQLYHEGGENQQDVALNVGLKLPTGDSDRLQGSGSTDISLWFSGGAESAFAAGKLASYGSAGLLFMTEGKVLPDQQKRWAAFGSLGVGWLPLQWLAFKVQADAHTPLFSHSDLEEIGANAVQLIVGGTIGLSEKTVLDLGVSEDLIVKTSPDVVFYLHLRTRF
jgi:hypothetical protein